MSKGHSGIGHIIDIMNECISEPTKSKPNWPVTKKLQVPVHKRGKFLGPGGINIKRLLANTGVQVTSDSAGTDGAWNIFAPNNDALEEAMEVIEATLAEEKVPELEFGTIYKVNILELTEKGVFVEIHPAMSPVFISNAMLDARKVRLLLRILLLPLGNFIPVWLHQFSRVVA